MRPALALVAACLTMMTMAGAQAQAPTAQRQAEVSARGPDVMPFNLAATVHVFTKEPGGGTQRVVARDSRDAAQAALVRQHLQDIRAQFLKGDFSGPSHIHGAQMPGLQALRSARPGQIDIRYLAVPGGAQLTFSTRDPALVAALHQWFDAQVSDHGKDAMAGHAHH